MKLTEVEKIRRRWIRALRSGKFKQGKGYLHKKVNGNETFCCLGVLCELAVKAKVIEPGKLEGSIFEYNGYSTYVPNKVRKWAGLSEGYGGYDSGESLASFNDEGKSFAKIADIIASKPEGLFEK